jgi:hypothetical protein
MIVIVDYLESGLNMRLRSKNRVDVLVNFPYKEMMIYE